MRSYSFLYAAAVTLTLCHPARSQPGESLPAQDHGDAAATADATYRQQVSYMIGRNIGNDLRQSQLELEVDTLLAGIRDALAGAEPRWGRAELQAASERFHQEMQQRAAQESQRLEQLAAENAKQAEAFLAKNRQREGVQVTASGLQYQVLQRGNGPSPTLADRVRCHYRGTLVDGTEFDSSYGGEPAEFAVRGVIPGWTEALQKMRVGDKWRLFVPPNLAYGPQPPGPPIEPNSTLIFEIELLDIVQQ